MLILLFLAIISLGFTIRWVSILTGTHKGAVLSLFEKYGPDEPVFYPLPQPLFWLGMLFLSGGILLRANLPFSVTFSPLGVLLLLGAALTHFKRIHFLPYFAKHPILPTWYVKLLAETARAERRRIAYMWLRLPRRTRLLYNANDRLFFVWAEQVIVATVS